MPLEFIEDAPAVSSGLEFIPESPAAAPAPPADTGLDFAAPYDVELKRAADLRDFEKREEESFEVGRSRVEDRGGDMPLRDTVKAIVAAKRTELGLPESRAKELYQDLDTLEFNAPAGKLSTGEVVVDPKLSLDPKGWEDAINGTDATPEAKARALGRRKEIRREVAPQIRAALEGDEGYTVFEKFNGEKYKDPADMVEAYLQRGGAFTKGLQQIGGGVKQGIANLSKTLYSGFAAVDRALPGSIPDFQNNADTAAGIESQAQAAREAIGGNIWMQRAGTLVSSATSMAPAVLAGGAGSFLAGETGGLVASAAASGAQSAAGTRQDALEAYRKQGMDEQEAQDKALGPALLSGLQTALTTAVFSGGVEKAFTAAAAPLAKATIKDTLIKIAKETGKGIADETAEEFSQTLLDGMIAQHSFNPDMSGDEVLKQAFEAGAYGGVLGGGMAGLKTAMEERAEAQARTLEGAGLSQAAAAIRANPAAVDDTGLAPAPMVFGGKEDAAPAETPPPAAPAPVPAAPAPSPAPVGPNAAPAAPAPAESVAGNPSTGEKILAAIEAAPLQADLTSAPSTIEFKDGGRTYVVQNTKEALGTLADKLGVKQAEKYLPAVRYTDGQIYVSRPEDGTAEFPHGHKEAEIKAANDGQSEKGVRGFVDSKGNFLTLMDVARAKGAGVEPAAPAEAAPAPASAPAATADQNAPPESEVVEGELVNPEDQNPPSPAEPAAELFPPGRDPTSIKNAQVDRERQRYGLPPAMEPLRRSFGDSWNRAMERISADPNTANTLVDQLIRKARPLDHVEDAILLHRQVELQNAHDATARRIVEAREAGNMSDVETLSKQAEGILDDLQRVYDVGNAAGTENSLGLNARKMLANQDFSLASMKLRFRSANKGKPMTEAQTVEIETLHARIRDLMAELGKRDAALVEEESNAAAETAILELVAEVEKEEGLPEVASNESAPEDSEDISEVAADGGGASLGGVPAVRIPAAEIASRPDLMQFKRMDDKASGVNEEDKLTGKFDDRKAGLLLLWEPADPAKYGLAPGQKYIVANGHHRVEFGARQGVTAYNAQIVREADGYSSQEARSLGAEINIADGKGTIYDQAKFLRNYAAAHGPDEAVEAGKRIGARGRKAAQIALSATDRLFDAFTNGAIDPDVAAALANAVPGNEAAQLAGMRAALGGKSPEFVANRARAEVGRDPNADRTGPVEFDLFGNEVFADIDAQAERATAEQKSLTDEIRSVRGAANKPELAAKHGVDVKDPEGVKKRIEELEALRARWENWPSHPDLVAITKSGAASTDATSTPALAAAAPAAEKPASKRAEKKKLLERALEALSTKADEARARMKQRAEGQQFFSGPINSQELDDLAIIGADYVAKGAKTLGRFVVKMVMEFGEYIRPHIAEIFALAREKERMARSPRDLNAERESIVRGMTSRMTEGDTLVDLRGYVRKLALNFVRRGVTEPGALIDAVENELRGIDPGITTRQTMDLVSGYGDFKALDPEKAKVTLRDLKGQMQQMGKLLDMLGKMAPKKTGVQQREVSAEESELIRQVNDAKKKGGFEVTDPDSQLKTALDSKKTRLNNEIRDLEEAIAGRPRFKRKTASPSDPETARLEAHRDALKEQLAAMNPKPGVTDAQRLAAAIEATRRSIAEYDRRLKEGDVSLRAKSSVTSPELEALRAQRAAVAAEYEQFRSLDEAVKAEREAERTRALEDQIAEIDSRLREGRLQGEKREAPLLTTAQEALVSERDAMLRKLNELRRAETAKPESEKQVEAILKQIDALDEKLRTGSFDPKTKVEVTPLSPEAEHLLAMRDAMRREILEQRKAAKPRKTKEEIALKAWKTRVTNQIAAMLDKVARGDFSTPERKPVKLDKEGRAIAYKLEEAKQRYFTALVEAKLANRGPWGKTFGRIGETLNLARALMTSIDLSGLLRQGGFIAIAHPIMAGRNVLPMLRAAMSEEARYHIEQEILNRPNAYLYRQTKLAITDNKTTLNRMEEAFMSRWAGQLVGFKGAAIGAGAGALAAGPLGAVLGGALGYVGAVPASERAYSTILNLLRADLFDLMAATLGKSADVTLQEARAIAGFVNTASGRPSLGQAGDKAATFMNYGFFAPKYVVSRFMLLLDPLTGFSISGGTGRVRGMVAKEYARYILGMAAVYALAKLAGGDDTEWDPRSSSFGKLKFGRAHVDPLSGIAQATVLLSRNASTLASLLPGDPLNQRGRNIKVTGGKFASLHHGDDDATKAEKIRYGGSDIVSVDARFLRTKLSPALGTFFDVASGQNVVGGSVTPGQGVARLFIPLSYNDILGAMEDQGVEKGFALSMLAVFGAGVQIYDENKPKPPKP